MYDVLRRGVENDELDKLCDILSVYMRLLRIVEFKMTESFWVFVLSRFEQSPYYMPAFMLTRGLLNTSTYIVARN